MTDTAVALAVACCVFAAVFVYPYLGYPASLRLLFKKRPIVASEASEERFCGSGYALLFCAYNESGALTEKMDNLRDLKRRYPDMRILAFDDGSSDDTFEVLSRTPDLLDVVRGPGRSGKAAGMKVLAEQTNADFLVFTDANVILDIDSIESLRKYYCDPEVGGVCGTLRYVTSDSASATEVSGGMYWRLEEKIKDLESRSGSVMGADGSIFSVRSRLYPDFPDTVQDDFTVSMHVIFAGLRLVKATDVVAYERLVADSSDELRRKIRIAARAYHTHQFLRPQVRKLSISNRYRYAAHKVLRWWGAVPAAMAGLLGVLSLLAFGPIGWIGLAVASAAFFAATRTARGSVVLELASAVGATFRGVMKARKGETFAVWTPPVSR